MAAFDAPFPAGTAVRGDADVTIVLPDPPRTPGAPIVRPGVARYAGATVTLLPLVAGSGTFPLLAPVTGLVRRIELATPLPGVPVGTLLELAPLPFADAAVLRLLPGLPTFVLAPVTTDPLPTDDELVARGTPLAGVAAAQVGLLFADRVALAPGAWVAAVLAALVAADPTEDTSDWRRLEPLLAPGRRLRLLDHVGRPAASYRVRVGGGELTADAQGEVPLPAGPVDVAALADGSGQPLLGAVHARYDGVPLDPADGSASTRPGEPLTLPATAAHPHVQVLDAPAWFAARPPGLDPGLGHLHPNSRLEPLVDGLASFAPMLADLRAATDPGFGAHFAGWAFNDFPLDPADPDGSMLLELVEAMQAGDGARFLMDKYLVLRDDAPTDVMQQAAMILLLAGVHGTLIISALKDLEVDDAGFIALVALHTFGVAALSLLDPADLVTGLLDRVDGSKGLFEDLESRHPGIALRSRHPARFEDLSVQVLNPMAGLLEPSDFIAGTGSYHQKFQVVRRRPDAHGNRVVGYLGGIDLNRNRLDTPGHHGRSYRPPDSRSATPTAAAFHDVHARLTGPAAADLALTFQRRWEFDITRQSDPPADQRSPAFSAPDPANVDEVPPQDARHLVQVCRTGFAPAAGGVPLPWSPQGEATIAEAIGHAIEQAREYIYLEDQYFTPQDPYVTALLDASVREPHLRLVIVVPTGSDQVFGDIRRRELFERLRDDPATGRGWGDRLVVAAPQRRPVLANAGRVASKGRVELLAPLSGTGSPLGEMVVLGPRSRLPGEVPFWLWVHGEKMLAVEKRDDVDAVGTPARRYLVRRPTGAEPLWGSHPRPHLAGAAVTLAQDRGIYVHTKAIVVDDVFVGIGSCNTNRRGFFHDGEIAAFAVPERLKSAAENPARALRTALWAEHLGLPPAMGRALLVDPVAAVDLFRRPTLAGNRLSSFAALGVTPELGFPGEASTPAKMFTAFGLVLANEMVPYVWNSLVDPTTGTDPAPVPGPGLGVV